MTMDIPKKTPYEWRPRDAKLMNKLSVEYANLLSRESSLDVNEKDRLEQLKHTFDRMGATHPEVISPPVFPELMGGNIPPAPAPIDFSKPVPLAPPPKQRTPPPPLPPSPPSWGSGPIRVLPPPLPPNSGGSSPPPSPPPLPPLGGGNPYPVLPPITPPGGGGGGGPPPPPPPPLPPSGGGGKGPIIPIGQQNVLNPPNPGGAYGEMMYGGGQHTFQGMPVPKGVDMVFTMVEKLMTDLGDSAKHFSKSLGSDTIAGTGAEAGKSVESFGRAFGGGFFGFELGGKAVKVVFEAIDGLQKWTDKLHESNMKFSEFSSAMASVSARQEVRDIELSRTRGDRRSESAEYLAEAKSRLQRELAPAEDSLANMKNFIVGYLDNKAADFTVYLKDIAKKLGVKIDEDEGDLGDGEGLAAWMDRVARDDHVKMMGRPRRFKDIENLL